MSSNRNGISSIVLRPARRSDLARIKHLVRYLLEVEGVEGIKKHADLILANRIVPTLKSSKNKTFVAERNGEIAGLILVEIKHNTVISLPFLVVGARYQGKGVGKKLVDQAKKYARSKKIPILEVLIHKDNKKSQEFHKKLGFHLFGFVFRRKV